MAHKRETWEQVLERKLTGYFIFLDIDGTLLPDGDDIVPEEMKRTVRELAEKNTIVLLSNSRRPERAQSVAEQVGLQLIKTRHRKPSKSVLRDVPEAKHPMLVIGDKVTTDALFARAVGAKCILVKRERSKDDRGWVNTSYRFDDVVGYVLDFFFRFIFENIAP
jgi:HAD superfamily phosphatase (TIGR01668 family)